MPEMVAPFDGMRTAFLNGEPEDEVMRYCPAARTTVEPGPRATAASTAAWIPGRSSSFGLLGVAP